MVPKTPIGRVYLRDVAEELLCINFTQDGIVLKIAQTVEEQLKERVKVDSNEQRGTPTYVLDHF